MDGALQIGQQNHRSSPICWGRVREDDLPTQRRNGAPVAKLQAFRDLAAVQAKVMRDTPIEGYCSKVGAATALIFQPCRNARDKWTDVRIEQMQHEIINANRADLSLILVPLRT